MQLDVRAARATGMGLHTPPERAFCKTCITVQLPHSYVGTCPDELGCGHHYRPQEVPRCATCGWPKDECGQGVGCLGSA